MKQGKTCAHTPKKSGMRIKFRKRKSKAQIYGTTLNNLKRTAPE